MKANMHYTPTESGYSVSASSERFNRILYGSHKNDDKEDKYATYAGDVPMFMGAATDWTVYDWCLMGKRGTLYNGLSLTPGQRIGGSTESWESGARWFHDSEDVVAEFKEGWMEYELAQMTSYFPNVKVKMEAYPLLPDDGFLVHYKISTDQRVVFTAGFGGITEYFGNFFSKVNPRRYFHAEDCKNNTIEIGANRACVRHEHEKESCSMWIGTSFPAKFAIGSAKGMETLSPALFLGTEPENADDRVVKISAVIEQGEELDGYIVVIHNADEATLNEWLTRKNPAAYIKQHIYAKHTCINMNTPERMLNLTVPTTVIAIDAAFHRNSFHHGTFSYHSPFLGWRSWYGPVVLGWKDRVDTVMTTHLNQMVEHADGEERTWYDGENEPETKGVSPYHNLVNSTGYLPYFLGLETPYYNMQECAFDMMLYHMEWTGNLDIARKYFDKFCAMLDWEERILDPDHDGLYQNFLNTWISDGHSYNGAGCAQASAYNYRANSVMAKIAKKLGLPRDVFEKRAEKIKKAVNEKLWIANTGVIAESLDTMGNCMIHPSPELNTTYLAIDCDIVDEFRAYTMLKYTENYIESITTTGRNGRLSYSSNWYPRKYSTCVLATAENVCLALAYFQLGLKEKAMEIVTGLSDCYFTGLVPGQMAHVQSNMCADNGDIDFTDVTSTYLRLMVEGLYGIRINAIDEYIMIAPNFPTDWEHAELTLKDISLYYNRKGTQEILDVYCDREDKKYVKIPMRTNYVELVLLDGEPIPYEIVAAPNNSFVKIEVEKTGHFQLRVFHGDGAVPSLQYCDKILAGNEMFFEVADGEIVEFFDICETLENVTVIGNKLYAKAKDIAGWHTVFIHVKADEYDAWLAADYEILEKAVPEIPSVVETFEPIDMTQYFNCYMTEVHNQKYLSPRPEGYSIGMYPNGRYAWDWNHGGHNKVHIDDATLREANGLVHTNSGIPFLTPTENENLACVSLWDNFPTTMSIPLSGTAKEVAVLFVVTTNSMQTQVENARITVTYADSDTTEEKLIYPFNVDDWLTPALQKQNETFYFNEYNHAIVERITVDPTKELASVKVEAIANEVIMGVIGVSVGK